MPLKWHGTPERLSPMSTLLSAYSESGAVQAHVESADAVFNSAIKARGGCVAIPHLKCLDIVHTQAEN